MKLIYLKSALKHDSFDATIGIKISFFKSFGYYWAGSLLTTVRYHELFDKTLILYGRLYFLLFS